MFAVEQRIVIHRPCAAVYGYIRQPGKLAALQPLVTAVDLEGCDAGGADSPLRYRVIEHVPLAGGRFSLRNVIEVEQRNDDRHERRVTSVVRVTGPLSLGGLLSLAGVQTMQLAPVEQPSPAQGQPSTLVVDRFEFHRYPPLSKRFIAATAERAHQTLLARLKAALEAM